MSVRTCALSVTLLVLGSTAAAQMQIVQQTRVISGVAHAQSTVEPVQHDTFSVSAPDAAPFQATDTATAAVTSGSSDSTASQTSQLTGNRITGEGRAGAYASSLHTSASAYSTSESRLDVTFQVFETVEYSLTGSLSQTTNSVQPTLELEQGGVPIHFVVIPPLSNGWTTFGFTGELTPGTYTLSSFAPAHAGPVQNLADLDGSWFEFVFALDPLSGTPFCAGDGTGAACPCGNDSAPSARVGCLSSQGVGGKLRAGGTASLSNDTLVLLGTQMPNSSALYFQGTLTQGGGSGASFGDGKRCAGGTLTRLRERFNVMGASQFPSTGDPSVSAQGAIAAPGTRTYQVWYRNAADFCTTSTFNLTNGVEVLWGA